MKVTNMSSQMRNPERVNVSIDGKYRFSLAVSQVVDYGVKVGLELNEDELLQLESESTFGKLYQRSLEYSLVRPRSVKEVRDYLYRKTLNRPVRSMKTGDIKIREGVSPSVSERVLDQLVKRGYVDDYKFAEYWVENRFMKKGISSRKLRSELISKGVGQSVIEEVISASDRSDMQELQKMIAKKRNRYNDDRLMQYLARQGFSYDDIKSALASED